MDYCVQIAIPHRKKKQERKKNKKNQQQHIHTHTYVYRANRKEVTMYMWIGLDTAEWAIVCE